MLAMTPKYHKVQHSGTITLGECNYSCSTCCLFSVTLILSIFCSMWL